MREDFKLTSPQYHFTMKIFKNDKKAADGRRQTAEDDLPVDELFPPADDSVEDVSDENAAPATVLYNGNPGDVMQRTVDETEKDWRLDIFLAHHYRQYSRTLIRNAIMNGGTIIDGEDDATHGKPSYRLKTGQSVSFTLPELPYTVPLPEPIPLDILYEDEYFAVINKPPNMVVHPSSGHWSGTMTAALAYHFGGQLSSNRGPVRPGIVHRLDRDTSGAIIVAKDNRIHAKLAELFERHEIEKEYFAIVLGVPHLDRDMIDVPVKVHPRKRGRMAVAALLDTDAKYAQTFYEVIKRYKKLSVVRCFPKTGRTHQIRVHLAHTGYPVLCDNLYGGRRSITKEEILGIEPMLLDTANANPGQASGTVLLNRQALHARRIAFTHPVTGSEFEIEAPIPADIQAVLDALESQ